MPVRKIPISHNSVTGRHAMGPGKRSIGYESTLERDFVSLMAFDPDVTDIEEQPVRIDFQDSEGRMRHYTPDYLVHRLGAPTLLIEVKPKKFLKPDLDAKFAAARRYAEARGWVFEVWTEREIRTPRLDNIRFLLPFRHRPTDPGRAARILRHFEEGGPMSGGAVLDACWSDETERNIGLGVLWHLIATGEIHTDLDKELTMDSVLNWAGRIS